MPHWTLFRRISAKIFYAQKKRNNALVERAVERLNALEHGKGLYNNDEPFIIAGGALSLPYNKLFPQDLHLFSHTKDKVYSVRRSEKFGNNTPVNREGTLITTVRQFLSERGVPAGEDYHISPDGVTGVQWDRTYNCMPANVRHIHAPILCMGMTGSHEFLAAAICFLASEESAYITGQVLELNGGLNLGRQRIYLKKYFF